MLDTRESEHRSGRPVVESPRCLARCSSGKARGMAWATIAMTLAASSALGGCKRSASEGSASALAQAIPEGGGELVALAVPDAGGGDAGPPSVMLHALAVITPVMNEPGWPARDPSKTSDERKGIIRLGYLRKGRHRRRETRAPEEGGLPGRLVRAAPRRPAPAPGPRADLSAAGTRRSTRLTRTSRRRRTRRTSMRRCRTTTA